MIVSGRREPPAHFLEERYRMQNPFEQRVTVEESMTQNGELKLSALLRMQHAAADVQIADIGLDVDTLLSHGYAFIITRLNVKINRLPRAGETVMVRTWPRNTKGVQFFRCFEVFAEDGSTLAECVSVYALVDTATHTLQRPSVLDDIAVIPDLGVSNSCPDPARRLPDVLTMPVGGLVIPEEWIDWNGHVNNAYYADILQNFIPDVYKTRPIRGFQLHFAAETLAGELMMVCTAEGDGAVLVRGMRYKDLRFEGIVTFG